MNPALAIITSLLIVCLGLYLYSQQIGGFQSAVDTEVQVLDQISEEK